MVCNVQLEDRMQLPLFERHERLLNIVPKGISFQLLDELVSLGTLVTCIE